MSDRTNWLLVSAPDNLEVSRARGFDIAGMKSRHRKKAEKVKPGDRVVYYLVGVKAVGGISEATGTYFESDDHIWTSSKEGEEYPFRFPVKPLYIRDKGDYVPMVDLVPLLEYPKRWPAEHWTLAFQGNVHVLNDADYQIIEDAVRGAKWGATMAGESEVRPSRLADEETAFVDAFIATGKRKRYRQLLSSPKRRKDVLKDLYHRVELLPGSFTRLQGSEMNVDTVLHRLQAKGGGGDCYVISPEADVDGRNVPLREMLVRLIQHDGVAILCCVSGELAFYKSERSCYLLENRKSAL